MTKCRRGGLKAQRDQTNKLISGQEQTLRRLADAYEAGALELDELTARTERIRTRLRHAHDERAEIEARLAQTFELKEIAGRVDEFAARIRGGLDAADWNTRRQLIRAVVEIGDGEVCVVYRVPGTPLPPNPSRDDDSSADPDSSGKRDPPDASCSLRWNGPARLTRERDHDLVATRLAPDAGRNHEPRYPAPQVRRELALDVARQPATVGIGVAQLGERRLRVLRDELVQHPYVRGVRRR